jgi:Aspartate carbamoyltransferase regulatory chain, metal binding domain
VPVRMALISLLLGLKGKSLHKFEGGFERKPFPVYDQSRSVGITCANTNCIVHEPMERQYVRNKFFIVKGAADACKLRCVYCENDIDEFVVASRKHKWFSGEVAQLLPDETHLKDLVVFGNEAEALAAGFHSRRTVAEHKPHRSDRLRARGKL